MKSFFTIVPLIVLLSGCDDATYRNVKAASLKLQQGMTEAEAISAIGFPPDSAELKTCGTRTKSGSWSCRILTFHSLNNRQELRVEEALVGDVWRVNSWYIL